MYVNTQSYFNIGVATVITELKVVTNFLVFDISQQWILSTYATQQLHHTYVCLLLHILLLVVNQVTI